jgi:hypothetical protein
MDRRQRAELERKLAQARRLSLEPSDPLTRERLAQLIEDLEHSFRINARLLEAPVAEAGSGRPWPQSKSCQEASGKPESLRSRFY